MAATLGKRILTYTAGHNSGGKLTMAESMAFNRQTLGMVGSILEGDEFPASQRTYVRFFRDRFEYYRNVENVADVAILYSHASMGFNNELPAVSFMLFSQVLIQGRIPFDIIFDEQLKDLSKYRVLVLADQECLSDEQMEQIRIFVKGGGGVVATELTSLYTPWRLRRRDFGLKDLFQVDAPPWRELGPEEMLKVGPVQNRVGQGRVAYVAEVRPAIKKPPAAWMTSPYWKLPLNWEELLEGVAWAAGEKLSLEVKTARMQNVVVELIEQEGRLLVHLLNYGAPNAPHVEGLEVNLQIPQGKQVTQVKILTPDREGEETVTPHSSGGRVSFTVPRLETYNLVILPLE
jgi:hypothetical protein